MKFYIVDDDEVHRLMLARIIEDEDLGEIIGEAEDGSMLDKNLMILKYVDILFIDLLMPVRDGIETIRRQGARRARMPDSGRFCARGARNGGRHFVAATYCRRSTCNGDS